jgi:hypothetical protein
LYLRIFNDIPSGNALAALITLAERRTNALFALM